MFGWLFGRSADPEAQERADMAWYEAKSAFFGTFLGQEHDHVMHALIPFAVGGGLDLYYFPKPPATTGTFVVTKELVETPGKGPRNRTYKAYELAIATRLPLDMAAVKDSSTPFGKAHSRMNHLLNAMALYAQQATLQPGETCEFPAEFDDIGGATLILDALAPLDAAKKAKVGLMLIMEIHPSECAFARANGGAELIARLKAKGFYPHSDLDRPPVV